MIYHDMWSHHNHRPGHQDCDAGGCDTVVEDHDASVLTPAFSPPAAARQHVEQSQ